MVETNGIAEDKVSVRIGCTHGSREYIHIEIIDDASHIRIVEVEMPFEEFARCITGLSVNDIPATFGNLSLVGKKLEVKTEHLPITYDNFKDFDKIVQPYEVDGWSARREDGPNYHRMNKRGYEVHFNRWV